MSAESVTCPRCEGRGHTLPPIAGLCLQTPPTIRYVAPQPCLLCKGRRRVSWTNPDAGYWMPVIIVKEPG